MSSPKTDPFYLGDPYNFTEYVPSVMKTYGVGAGVGYGSGLEGRTGVVLGDPEDPVQSNLGANKDPFYLGDPYAHDTYVGSTQKPFGEGMGFGNGYVFEVPDDSSGGVSAPVLDTDDNIILDTDGNPI